MKATPRNLSKNLERYSDPYMISHFTLKQKRHCLFSVLYIIFSLLISFVIFFGILFFKFELGIALHFMVAVSCLFARVWWFVELVICLIHWFVKFLRIYKRVTTVSRMCMHDTILFYVIFVLLWLGSSFYSFHPRDLRDHAWFTDTIYD